MPGTTRRRNARAGTVAVVLALGAALSACGSGNGSATQSTTSTTSGGAGATSLSSMVALSKNSTATTFQAGYTYKSGGTTEAVTFAQSPPKYMLSTASGLVLYDGTHTYFCGADKKCVVATMSNPLASQVALFNGTTFQTSTKLYTAVAAVLAALGVTLTYSTATYAGQHSSCATIARSGAKATWCVTDAGLLSYWSAGSASFALTSYTASPPGSAFTLPPGYTTVSVPAIG